MGDWKFIFILIFSNSWILRIFTKTTDFCNFRKQEPFEIETSFYHQYKRNIWLLLRYAKPKSKKTKIWLLLGYFFAKRADFFREWFVWVMDFVLTSIDAQHMTFIEICKAEIENTKIWLVLGYFLQKWLIFLENDWFDLWISFYHQCMRNIWLLLR